LPKTHFSGAIIHGNGCLAFSQAANPESRYFASSSSAELKKIFAKSLPKQLVADQDSDLQLTNNDCLTNVLTSTNPVF
jgi:hypothetical protein